MMRRIYPPLILFLGCLSVQADEIDYEAELRRAMQMYPPGDYDQTIVRRFPVRVETHASAGYELFKAVEPSEKELNTLFSEAASYFKDGRWDLAAKRYKQCLLIDPANKDAKANLYDLLLLHAIHHDESRLHEFRKLSKDFSERISKDILIKEQK